MAKQNPRIVVTVNTESVNCKGAFIDTRDNVQSFNKSFNDENEALNYLYNMRDNANAEFSIQVNRINWKTQEV